MVGNKKAPVKEPLTIMKYESTIDKYNGGVPRRNSLMPGIAAIWSISSVSLT